MDEITSSEPDREPGRLGAVEIITVVVFCLGLAAWIWALPIVRIVFSGWVRSPDEVGCAGIGILMIGPVLAVTGLVLFLASALLGVFAGKLPVWFRVLTVTPSGLLFLSGLAFIYRALS